MLSQESSPARGGGRSESPSPMSRCDLIARLRYRSEFQMLYFAAVVLSVVLLLSSLVGDSHIHNMSWYILSEAFLTAFFVIEVLTQMVLTGPFVYLARRSNVLELLLCMACCTIFGLSVSKGAVRIELESLLLLVRYSTQFARLYWFVRNQHQGSPFGRVQLHTHDNPAISISRGGSVCPSGDGSISPPPASPTESTRTHNTDAAWSHLCYDDEDGAGDVFIAHDHTSIAIESK